jgi:4-hydroxybenzoate polyprenyltransferase
VVGYDTIYALQDIEDDEIAGIKSSARLFGERVRDAVGLCYLAAIVLLTVALVLVKAGVPAYLGLLLFGIHLSWQTRQVRRGDDRLALRLFRSNRDAGLILFAGLWADSVLRAVG